MPRLLPKTRAAGRNFSVAIRIRPSPGVQRIEVRIIPSPSKRAVQAGFPGLRVGVGFSRQDTRKTIRRPLRRPDKPSLRSGALTERRNKQERTLDRRWARLASAPSLAKNPAGLLASESARDTPHLRRQPSGAHSAARFDTTRIRRHIRY